MNHWSMRGNRITYIYSENPKKEICEKQFQLKEICIDNEDYINRTDGWNRAIQTWDEQKDQRYLLRIFGNHFRTSRSGRRDLYNFQCEN